jgi:hypothetical protein
MTVIDSNLLAVAVADELERRGRKRRFGLGDFFVCVFVLIAGVVWTVGGSAIQRRSLAAWEGDYVAARMVGAMVPGRDKAEVFAEAYDDLHGANPFTAIIHYWRASSAHDDWAR